MTGLEKMKGQILEEARAAARAKVQEAQRQAEEMLAQARAEAEKTTGEMERKAGSDIVNYKERTASALDLRRRTGILAAKQEIISEVLEKSFRAVREMEAEQYFALLEKMLRKYVLPQEGEIFFSEADQKRMPDGFKERIQAAAREKGGSLAIKEESRNVEDGFILVYGGVEENCTLRAIFDARKDALSDRIHGLLF